MLSVNNHTNIQKSHYDSMRLCNFGDRNWGRTDRYAGSILRMLLKKV